LKKLNYSIISPQDNLGYEQPSKTTKEVTLQYRNNDTVQSVTITNITYIDPHWSTTTKLARVEGYMPDTGYRCVAVYNVGNDHKQVGCLTVYAP
jgi:hypothetical protein